MNFVSDPGSWQAVQDLKSDLGRDIVKVATGDFDEMETVRLRLSVVVHVLLLIIVLFVLLLRRSRCT